MKLCLLKAHQSFSDAYDRRSGIFNGHVQQKALQFTYCIYEARLGPTLCRTKGTA